MRLLSCVSGSQYGDVADECADAYFWYGKALLEVARQEGGILGDAVPGGKLTTDMINAFFIAYCNVFNH